MPELKGNPSSGYHAEFNFSCTHAAVSNSDGTVQFPLVEFGSGGGGIGKKSRNETLVTVPQRTLAALMPPSVEFIDVLLTDTEGHDFDVYEG